MNDITYRTISQEQPCTKTRPLCFEEHLAAPRRRRGSAKAGPWGGELARFFSSSRIRRLLPPRRFIKDFKNRSRGSDFTSEQEQENAVSEKYIGRVMLLSRFWRNPKS